MQDKQIEMVKRMKPENGGVLEYVRMIKVASGRGEILYYVRIQNLLHHAMARPKTAVLCFDSLPC